MRSWINISLPKDGPYKYDTEAPECSYEQMEQLDGNNAGIVDNHDDYDHR